MKALITGSGGFVGPHLRAHLEACGDEVVSLDRNTDPSLDVTEPKATRDAIEKVRPDAIYHLAALSHVGDSWNAPQLVFRVNIEGALNVMRAASDIGGPRVLLIGSSEEYGHVAEQELPIRETTALQPLTPYGVSKTAAELLGRQQFLSEGLPVIRVRPFSHTGPGQSERFVVPAFAKRILEAKSNGANEIPVGNLDAVRDFSDVRDVVRAYRLLVESGQPGEVYNVCSGIGISMREMAEELVRLSGTELKLRIDSSLVRPIEIPTLIGDCAKLRSLGWKPEFALPQTLQSVLTYFER